jgi:hypothetical protein
MVTIDVKDLERWTKVCQTAPARASDIMRMTMNDVGNAARTQVVRTLSRQMGLPNGTVRQGLTIQPATTRRMDYAILSQGGYLSLRSFDAEQRRAGVSARPWGKRRIFRGTFVVRSLGGQVYRRTTSARFPIVKLWGPAMPQELVRGAVPKAFEDTARARLPARLAHHLDRLLPRPSEGLE